jgi:uncharacterized protein
MSTLGVISDTHIPDRRRSLHPQIIPIFREAGVSAILHAGDVISPKVLASLNQVAPVYAVRGNRDWVWLRQLPFDRMLSIQGVTIALTHGHGRWWTYLVGRIDYIRYGVRQERYQLRLLKTYPQAQVIVFGHTHRPINLWVDGRLLFNPGSPHFPDKNEFTPSIGLLHILNGGEVQGEIIKLE